MAERFYRRFHNVFTLERVFSLSFLRFQERFYIFARFSRSFFIFPPFIGGKIKTRAGA